MRVDRLANRRKVLSLDNMSNSFLTYRQSMCLKLGGFVAVLSIVVYIVYYFYLPASMPPGGGTMLGLLYGAVATAAIMVLMAYSVRKRSYRSRLGTLQGWLSAHCYIGLLTLLWVPLHSGFRFSTNVHTLAYVLLVLVALSGLLGAYLFAVKPRQFVQYGAEIVYPGDVVDRDNIDSQMNRTMQQIETLSQGKPQVFQQLCKRGAFPFSRSPYVT
ncbi:hypothetical protein [Candidatus Entotheonella palauensis]|uniref:hypothetical protein n=1 Tax=Candidatus Entotheonella palauensis TaxID=93172 RepID=UPI000B8001C1|nr:hypothetical protein [Candidatus Entotheonella palauensis]